MPRVRYRVARRKRKKKILKMAKGQWGDRSKRFRHAKESLLHSLSYAYRDRRTRKRNFRRLWIVRINAACKQVGISYRRFIQGLKKAKVKLNRKMLAELAVNDTVAFGKLVEIARQCIS